jgi:NADH-quinone oxidoreductase subunit L
MLMPLYILAIGAIFSGYVFFNAFVGLANHHHKHETHQAHQTDHAAEDNASDHAHSDSSSSDDESGEHSAEAVATFPSHKEAFWQSSLFVLPENDTVEAGHFVEKWVKLLPLGAGLLGLFLSYVFYILRPEWPAKTARVFSALHRLFFNKWYFDEIYHALFVKPSLALGRIFWIGGDKNIIDRFGPDGSALASLKSARLFSRFQSGYVFQYAFVMMIAVIALTSWFIFRAQTG